MPELLWLQGGNTKHTVTRIDSHASNWLFCSRTLRRDGGIAASGAALRIGGGQGRSQVEMAALSLN